MVVVMVVVVERSRARCSRPVGGAAGGEGVEGIGGRGSGDVDAV